jgi:hypothetical protein
MQPYWKDRVGGKTSLVEGYQILRCCEEYPGSLERGSFPEIFQGADQRLPWFAKAETLFRVHIVWMEFNLKGFSNNAVHVSCFCGQYGGTIELNTVFLVDAVLSYGRLVRIFQTDVAFMFFQSGVRFTRCSLGVVSYESLPTQELTTSLCACLHSYTLKMEAIRSSETSVLIRATRRHLPEDDNHQKWIVFGELTRHIQWILHYVLFASYSIAEHAVEENDENEVVLNLFENNSAYEEWKINW